MTLPKWEPYAKYESERAKDQEILRQKEEKAKLDLALYADAIDGLANGGIFYSRTLHPTGLLPFMGTNVLMTRKDVQKDLSVKGKIPDLYRQELSKEGKDILQTCPKQLELSIYREVTEEMELIPDRDYSVLWEFVHRLEDYANNGFQEGEDGEKFAFLVSSHRKEFKEFFGELSVANYMGYSDQEYFEIPYFHLEDLIPIKEKIAGLELSCYKACDILREEDISLEEVQDWNFF